jgi:ligand-binding SRPBCC domain-containing protein
MTHPTIDRLHEDYAAQRRIDPSAPVTARRELVVDAPVEQVWALLADPRGWHDVDPKIHAVELDGDVAAGTRFTWRNGPVRLRSRFAVVDPLHELTWTGTALGTRAVHRHVFTATTDGRTQLVTEESMDGLAAKLFFSSKKLGHDLEAWLTAIAKAAATDR